MLTPGHGLLQRFLQLLNSGARKDSPLVAQQIVGVHFLGHHQLHPVEIARTESQGPTWLLAGFHQQGRTLGIELVQRRAIGLGLGVCQLQGVDYGQLAVSQLRSQRGTQSAEQLLARESVIVTVRLGSVNGAAMTPDRRPHGTDASAASTLLLPQLLARSRDQLLVLGGGSALAQRSTIVL